MTTKIKQKIVEVNPAAVALPTDEQERYTHLMEAMKINKVPFLKEVLHEHDWLELELDDQISIAEAWVCEFVFNGVRL